MFSQYLPVWEGIWNLTEDLVISYLHVCPPSYHTLLVPPYSAAASSPVAGHAVRDPARRLFRLERPTVDRCLEVFVTKVNKPNNCCFHHHNRCLDSCLEAHHHFLARTNQPSSTPQKRRASRGALGAVRKVERVRTKQTITRPSQSRWLKFKATKPCKCLAAVLGGKPR